jgi:hypothetical protein
MFGVKSAFLVPFYVLSGSVTETTNFVFFAIYVVVGQRYIKIKLYQQFLSCFPDVKIGLIN